MTTQTIKKSFCEAWESRHRVREMAAEAKRRMGDKERQQLNVNEVMVLGAIGITWLICSTVLIANGQPKEVPILSGIVLLLAGVSRFLSKQQKVEHKAEQERQIIRAEVQETKQHAADAAAKVNGVTHDSQEAMLREHEKAMSALRQENLLALEKLEKRAEVDRHKHDGQLQALTFMNEEKDKRIEQLLRESGSTEGKLIECRELLAKYQAPPVPPKPAAMEPGEANIP